MLLSSFRTSKGAEYSCHFMGNCLVVSCDKEGKNSGRSALSKCVKAELKPRKWHHVVLSHNYSRWGRSDVSCYIDGHLAETVQLNWYLFLFHLCMLILAVFVHTADCKKGFLYELHLQT